MNAKDTPVTPTTGPAERTSDRPRCPKCGSRMTQGRESDQTILCRACLYRGARADFVERVGQCETTPEEGDEHVSKEEGTETRRDEPEPTDQSAGGGGTGAAEADAGSDDAGVPTGSPSDPPTPTDA